MRRMFLFCLMASVAMAGCQSTSPYEYDKYDEYDEYLASFGCNSGQAGCGVDSRTGYRFIEKPVPAPANEIKFSMPNGNDLVLETSSYVVQVEGAPNKKYQYYVWAGNKDYTDDPDLIINDGSAAILVQE